MKAIKYVGPLPEIHIQLTPDSRVTAISGGDEVNVPDAVADELVKRGDFKSNETPE